MTCVAKSVVKGAFVTDKRTVGRDLPVSAVDRQEGHSMRAHKSRGRHMAKLGAIVMVGGFLTAQAVLAQSDGDEMCSKKGNVRVFNESSRSWEESGGHCTPRGPNSPVNGDEKCGSAGFVVKYVAKIDMWRNTDDHCGGSSPQGGVYIRHQGL
jgi:hypothetical protein